ncbi:MAG TPA: hypothetical protein VK102_08630 [Sphingobacterium sp.]|nr:hypothetical protein [Sphingobacterium sp.]
MHTLQSYISRSIKDRSGRINNLFTVDKESDRFAIALTFLILLIMFLYAGRVLQFIDPAAGILDIGILSLFPLGLIGGVLSIYFSTWLQELLWKPFRMFRKQFHSNFNQLTSWQQCILYFSVFFLLLYGLLWALAMVL